MSWRRLAVLSAGVGCVGAGAGEWAMPPNHWPWLLLDFAGGVICYQAARRSKS